VADEDRMIPRKTQLFMAERMNAHVHAVSADHTPIVSSPDAVVNIILDAVRENAKASRG
jgi:pimeloyl-ACP methyl ester carboxylesterase